ncbi:IS110 family transposase [Shewanella aestuarii]|uniref:IS110 family transposase n=1 Tax=Shewanella aestuarii TaxID=1028752 RepID=A0A6G9QH61_9GAMM|nr:IS110 family transposase [Shewanella aestuarii]QIR13405.1 IS110 family transposase [Shewanella aestuarii]
MSQITRVGVDIAKSVFHVHAVDRFGERQWKGKYSRTKWLNAITDKVPQGAEVAMEACGSSHYWGRELQKRGYKVKIIHAQFVKPYVKSNKNDAIDAEAICEAMSRPNMRFVCVKSNRQQDIQSMHRIRDKLMVQKSSKANQIRGLVSEYGLVAPVGINKLREAIPLWLEDVENGLSALFRSLLLDLFDDLRRLQERVDKLDNLIQQEVKNDPVARSLLELRGVGVLCASALSCAIGDAKGYRKGRDFAASIGLTPRQHSTGGKPRLLGISKRGDGYLRKLLVHGARSVIRHAHRHDDNLSKWIAKLCAYKHVNIVIVALANKTARAAWAMVNKSEGYHPELIASA